MFRSIQFRTPSCSARASGFLSGSARLRAVQCQPRVACQRIVTRAEFGDSLENWQLEKLYKAAQKGKRQVKIQELARATELDRTAVLEWFKEYNAMPESLRKSQCEAAVAAMDALRERKTMLRQDKAAKQAELDSRLTYQEVLFLKRTASQTRMKKEVERTLEAVYAETKGWPSDSMIQSTCDLHRLNRKTALKWFQDRRARDGHAKAGYSTARRGGRRKGGAGGGTKRIGV